jgi:hypothetical protein
VVTGKQEGLFRAHPRGEGAAGFAALMRQEGFDRFEEALEEFRVRFDDRFLSES